MVGNLKDELYQLENKLGIGAKLCGDTRWGLDGQKCSETIF